MIRGLVALLLVLTASSLTPLANAATVDPTWIAGLYDNADGDDAILAVQSFVGDPGPRVAALDGPVVDALHAISLDRLPVRDAVVGLAVHDRAPPSA